MANKKQTETVEIVENEEKPYVLYELQAQHLFLLTRVISKLDLKRLANVFTSKVDVNSVVQDDEKATDEAIRNVGVDTVIEIVGMVIENLPNCQNELFKFLAAISNLNEKQVAALPLNHFVDMVSDVIHKEEFADFFTACGKFLK